MRSLALERSFGVSMLRLIGSIVAIMMVRVTVDGLRKGHGANGCTVCRRRRLEVVKLPVDNAVLAVCYHLVRQRLSVDRD